MFKKIKSNCLFILLFLIFSANADLKKGEEIFKMYCATCHGPEGAGLLGPNLTDKEVLHGEKIEDIVRTVSAGILDKGMPAWESILKPQEVQDVAEFVKSIMGKNLPSPFITAKSNVTPFPKGTLEHPLLLRTFMPKVGLGEEVFANHGKGEPVPKYNPKNGTETPDKFDQPIDGIPAAIAVNFGDRLSYCFDTTECRLLYIWQGNFIDMTNYWGKDSGGSRKGFGYVPQVIGKITFKTSGEPPISGKPVFKGYRKVKNIPEFSYAVGEVNFTLKITPSEDSAKTVCSYTSDAKNGLKFSFSKADAANFQVDKGELKEGILTLNPDEAKAFTITISATK